MFFAALIIALSIVLSLGCAAGAAMAYERKSVIGLAALVPLSPACYVAGCYALTFFA